MPPALRAELERIAETWRDGEPQKGFVMALDTLFGRDDDGDVFVIGNGPDGRPQGFIHFADVAGLRRALPVVDAAAADDAERLQRVADLRDRRLGT